MIRIAWVWKNRFCPVFSKLTMHLQHPLLKPSVPLTPSPADINQLALYLSLHSAAVESTAKYRGAYVSTAAMYVSKTNN